MISQSLSQLSMKDEDDNETMVSSNVKDANKRQRSTPLSSPNVVPAKKMKVMHDDDIDDEQITTTTTEGQQLPNYLSIKNRFFIAMARNILKTNSTITIDDIQQLALFIHQKAVIHSRRELIKVYLLSIMGKLQQTDYDSMDIDRRFWPIQVQSLLLNRRKSSSTTADTAATTTITTTSTTVTDMISTEEQLACQNTLQEQLREMKEEIERYQQLFDEKKNSLTELTSTMEESIEAYVQNYGIRVLKLKHDFKMTLVKHDYDAEILRRKYMHEQPNEYQVRLLKI